MGQRLLWSWAATMGFTLLGGLAVIWGCSSAPASDHARADQSGAITGAYRLVAVGDRVPEYWSRRRGGCDVPTFSLYRFEQERWLKLDTLRGDEGCGVGLPPDTISTNTDSGYYRIVGDTLNLYVRDTMIGLKGWVSRLLIRGDTLVLRAGEFSPGDYIYTRQRP